LTESANADAIKVKQLTEKLNSVMSEAQKSEKELNEQLADYRKKLSVRTETAKQYKAQYQKVLEGYIARKAELLGVRTTDITSRLNESYTLEDIDNVCDSMLTDYNGWNTLPFGSINRSQAKAQITESIDKDDDLADLYELAGLK